MTQNKKETIGSVLMYIALALTAIYLIFAIISLFGIVGMKNDFAKLGAMLALRYLLPFTICMVINFFLTGVSAISKNWIVTLISCILYFVAIIFVPERFYCSTVQGVLSFISIFLFFNRGFEKENVEEDERANLPDLPIQE